MSVPTHSSAYKPFNPDHNDPLKTIKSNGSKNEKIIENQMILMIVVDSPVSSHSFESHAGAGLVRFPNPLATGSDIHGSWGT